ncbi:SDR family oxidoreductase [Nonomuraea sp. NPDC050153]|uniref:SDR family oxidoreductase n=1 Tax=Nonomuraea sp. NPDC050153 TaxID=3364359 RepID=UPI0037AE16E0
MEHADAQDGGRIINLSAAATRIAMPEQPYARSKAAVEALSRSLAQLAGGRGITVNAVAPGPTVTDPNPWMPDDPEVLSASVTRSFARGACHVRPLPR